MKFCRIRRGAVLFYFKNHYERSAEYGHGKGKFSVFYYGRLPEFKAEYSYFRSQFVCVLVYRVFAYVRMWVSVVSFKAYFKIFVVLKCNYKVFVFFKQILVAKLCRSAFVCVDIRVREIFQRRCLVERERAQREHAKK